MEQIVQQYIQAKGLNEQQAQQLIQELQKLDEQQLQQVVGKMQQQLGEQNAPLEQQMSPDDIQQAPQQMGEEMMMQYGGKKTYEQWKQSLPNNLKNTDTTLYNLRGAYEGDLYPELSDDGFYHLGSRNPKTGELLKSPKHPTFNKMIEGEKKAGYEVFEKNGKLYSKPKLKQQYGGVPVSMDGLYEFPNQKVVVPNGNITMKGINYPVEAYDADNGKFLQTMLPNQNYQFDVDNVLEVPKGKFGISKMQSGGSKVELTKQADGKFVDKNGEVYVFNPNNNTFITGWNHKAIPFNNFNIKDINLTQKEKNKFLNNTLPEVTIKGKKPPITNYFQPNSQPLPNNFNSNLTDSTSQYSGNTPVEAIGNPNLRAGDRVDTVGGKPVKDFGISNKTDKFGFVSRLKGEKTSKQDNINDYKTWVKDWSTKIDGFDKLPYANQQMVAMQWVKTQRPDVYDVLKKQWEAKGYNKNGKGFEGFLNDGMYANITSSLRPSTLTNNEEPVPNFVDANLPVESGNSQPINYTGTVDENPISLPNQNDDEEELDMKDVVLGKLNNTDYSGRYLSNLKLRNNTIKMPYFGRTDLKNPSLYTQNISPYLNDLYAANNSAKQNLDMNSAVGQSAQIQLGANLLDRVNDVSGKVYNTNMQQTVNWENALADIYNKQQQIDDGNRRQYDDDVNRILANKQNVDNEIDRMGYEFKQTGVRNKNNLLLSQMLHPNFVIQDDGALVRKGEKFNKGYNEYLEEEMKRLKEENDKLKTKVAKYGIKKKLK